ncbi:MGDG synthase family glycosyltransferase [Clostridium beijerinckii]|jgi:Monogalactosyldiacylglycerol synthase (EC 2.4.1.46)|uniref:UDP-N-acetylglucosamine--LPS N-acetylglucosamine transferase n=2 Tax=Clostridium beijerinckii TaxID=1520 RepID=A0AAE2V0B1_CLOBE|nr:glycosyltransferase [Clostridium beijerinckii]ABR32588.1 Monogalactosyldiacylglycerol synthase [Clostridium beijerinckii NCIMB 8052]AIU02434.1 monogalactosyldiacylglycerol synthase [Clostridium beijerinckii ATCC 35702]MBF7807732.1 UDP-N-acetylglucosamine--LPS N-acetylglucosamine transferase [Clostridium beijerinckii]NOW88348.1 processive 1,2-diacylglycerol beta-glucosyltransferase [Clostridium beijerinckii]NRT26181.1 processive 1,2-diacylglycerol beta-glucosyltransferase [Clostridium beijer
MKKVLILTTSTGQGHNQAAASVEESFNNSGYEITKLDFLAKNSKLLNDIIVIGYEFSASKFPKTYGFFYKLTDTNLTNKLLKLIFFMARKKVSKLINKIQPDVIIATHSINISVISDLKKNGLDIPFILVVTDFKAHYLYVDSYVDAYITGSNYTKKSLVDRGINPNKIYPIGIPISSKFYTEVTSANDLKDDEYFNLLLMGGSLGLTTIFTVLKELLKNPHKLRITVVCGKNDNLKNRLISYCKENKFKNKKLHILGFTKDISYLMDYCDILISKPGGLTVTESIVKNIPLIIPFAIPGQENENIDFLTSEGYSIYVKDLSKLNDKINYLINNPNELSKIKLKLKELSSTYSLTKIVDIADDLISKK